ncbi:unnamed protein product [Bursaphelenchus okinawaensis]|uniref:Uncharacterized protein n=1 Tax=Bursaphelenchus okinawaensis TaxID=465554 RepID=A0A811LQJ2_9BILA|nr:unnamed protein product [Bursaphelenchus okinawaensis]CAG9127170.1 unnamed protein product [Bursaphelenchus okinawaensis]
MSDKKSTRKTTPSRSSAGAKDQKSSKRKSSTKKSTNDKAEEKEKAKQLVTAKKAPSPDNAPKIEKKDPPVTVPKAKEKRKRHSDSEMNTSVDVKSLSRDDTPSDGRRVKPKEDEGPVPEL